MNKIIIQKIQINKQIIIRILAVYLASFSFNYGYGQQDHEQELNHQAHGHTHNNGIGAAIGVVAIPQENKTALGIHLHYTRGVGQENRYGIGTSLGIIILEDHQHYTISLATHCRIYKGFTIGYSPGLLILKHDSKKDFHFAQHFELVYEFELGNLHLGPIVEIGYANRIAHYMTGIHVGIGF